MSKQPRYIPTPDQPQNLLSFNEDREILVQKALRNSIGDNPPQAQYSHHQCRGLFSGPTALAYLLLNIGARYPKLKIHGHSLRHWAISYMRARRTGGDSASCGLACESIAFSAVQTMLDGSKASKFRDLLMRAVDEYQHPHELLFGYSGLLYMIRAVEFWKPETTSLLAVVKARIVENILGAGPGWTWHGKRYIGAVHGDIGILTQLVLTDTKLGHNPMVRSVLRRLLNLQRDDGNWPSKDQDDARHELVQFCHGAPGFISSLLHVRPYFTGMEDDIDNAINAGRKAVWREGLLRKEPCLCHGILGNLLVLPPGSQRDHFLAWSLPNKIEEEKRADETVFRSEDRGRMSTWFNYWPSAAWTWTTSAAEVPSIILYDDI
ncbi:LanC-like protein GCL2 [Colletotrichum chlorophyti]|uniref:LanC-like protein GCL2 n=1 Tax=Colletotrichum chlorophyti TaxID=708187 RepID=A0A1Q8RDC7_9PEZI|nr:LanC-like protein GCL2 [Colletotrichum chlorophyti]